MCDFKVYLVYVYNVHWLSIQLARTFDLAIVFAFSDGKNYITAVIKQNSGRAMLNKKLKPFKFFSINKEFNNNLIQIRMR